MKNKSWVKKIDFKALARKILECEPYTLLICLLILAGLSIFNCVVEKINPSAEIKIFNWAVFFTILCTAVVNWGSELIKKLVGKRIEDSAKLTENYERLNAIYILEDKVMYDNLSASTQNINALIKNELQPTQTIPISPSYDIFDLDVKIYDKKQSYFLPKIIENNAKELFAAHSNSKYYNALHIRVYDWKIQNGEFCIYTSRTTFYNSLLTNRMMDYKWSNGFTVRDLFECGPFLSELSNSSLSNNLGFNGFIESSDGYIMFIRRWGDISIGKNTYGSSVSGSIKTKYALDRNGDFSAYGLLNSIIGEINDETKINRSNINGFTLKDNVFAAYRELVEGGKPQLVFYATVDIDRDAIEEEFIRHVKGKKYNEFIEDGKYLLWINRNELLNICICADGIIYDGKRYKMLPTITGSLVLLINYLKNKRLL